MFSIDSSLYKLFHNRNLNPFLFLLTTISLYGFFIVFPFDMILIAAFILITALTLGFMLVLFKAIRIAYLKMLVS